MQLQPNTLFHNRYTLIHLIGRGGFSEVWLAKDAYTNLEIALKIYTPNGGLDDDGIRQFSSEIGHTFNLSHPNLLIPRHLDVCDHIPYLIMPYCPEGAITKQAGRITEVDAWQVLKDAAAGLAYLHNSKIVHLDIKPDNILKDTQGHYLITDFGISSRTRTKLTQTTMSQNNCTAGTSAYMPPERFYGDKKPIPASDMWALGATLFELMSGAVPFGDGSLPGGLLQKNGEELSKLPNTYSQSLQRTVISLLALNPQERPAALDIIETPTTDNIVPPSRPTQRAVPQITNEKIFTVKGVSFKMVYVHGGTFTMGATADQDDANQNEYPVHQVSLSDYYIGETEVTHALWQAVMGSNTNYNAQLGRYPIANVSYDDCQKFISNLNRLTGMLFRLPTEAEWEFAARGGCKSNGYKYAGSDNIDTVAWYVGNSCELTHPVKSKTPNELGLYDMSGSVWEWCNDWYGPYSSNGQTDPQGPNSGSYRVSRGGSYCYGARSCRVSDRRSFTPSYSSRSLGLRLALSL